MSLAFEASPPTVNRAGRPYPPVFASSSRPTLSHLMTTATHRTIADFLAPYVVEEALHGDRARRALALAGLLARRIETFRLASGKAPTLKKCGKMLALGSMHAILVDPATDEGMRFESRSYFLTLAGFQPDSGAYQPHAVLDQHWYACALVRSALLTASAGIAAIGLVQDFRRPESPEPPRKLGRLLKSVRADVATTMLDRFFPTLGRHADSLALLAMLMRHLVAQRMSGMNLTLQTLRDELDPDAMEAIPNDPSVPKPVREWFEAWLDDPYWKPHDGPCVGRDRVEAYRDRTSTVRGAIVRLEEVMALWGVA